MHFFSSSQTALRAKSAKQATCRAPSNVGCTPAPREIEIDVDSEIEYLELWSGVAAEAGHEPAQVYAFVGQIALQCAEAADHGGKLVEMIKAADFASRHRTQPWRIFALLFAQRCETLVRNYGVDTSGERSGEVVRWLFADLGKPCIQSETEH